MRISLQIKNKASGLLCSAVACLVIASCAHNGANAPSSIPDPLEGLNRQTLKFNEVVDKSVLMPIAKGYRYVTPAGGRTIVRNFLQNLNSPVIIGNELLQGDLDGAGNATARVVINTLAGFGGLFDFAAESGFPYRSEDFGQTLGKWGVGDGLYLMVPLLGPSSLRDSAGRFVDGYVDPLRIYLFNIDRDFLHYTRTGTETISQREDLLEIVEDLRRNSFDYYAAIRSAYYQRRQAEINDESVINVIPDYDDL